MADPKSPPESRRDQRPVDPFPPEVGSWPIYAVLERLEARDWRLAPYVALPILRRLAEAGQLRSRGRRCDETGLPYGATIEIATAEWIGLEFPPALFLGPHPGTVHERTARHRTVYAEVELSGADLSQLWRSGAFQQPGWASAATPPPSTLPGSLEQSKPIDPQRPQHPPTPTGITEERWRVVCRSYAEHVSAWQATHDGHAPLRNEDMSPKVCKAVGITRPEMRAVRGAWRAVRRVMAEKNLPDGC